MIQEIKSGSNVSAVFLIKEIQFLKTKDKRPYTAITFVDRTGEIRAFIWDRHLSHLSAGRFCKASGVARENKGEIVIRLKDSGITPVPRPDNLDDYIYSLDALTIKKLWEELIGFVEAMQDEFYKSIVKKFLEIHDDFNNEFSLKTCPLTDELYGNYAGALLEHIVYCLRHAKAVHHNYWDRNCPIDPDLLTAILIMHDAGRLVSFAQIFNVRKTKEAKLTEQHELSIKILEQVISKTEMRPDSWDATKHLKLFNGVVVAANLDKKPNTIEGMLAQKIQNMDALTGAIARTLNFAKQDKDLVYCKATQSEIYNG